MNPRTESSFAEMRKKSRELIINEATILFAENGFRETTIEKIARKAGISKGLIYNYFSSKDDLLESIITCGFPYFDEIADNVPENLPAIDQLESLLNNFITSLKKNLAFWKLYQSIISHPTVSRGMVKFKEYFETVFSPLLSKIFTALFTQISESEISIEVLIFAALLDGIAFDYVVIGEDYPLESIKQKIINNYQREVNTTL